MMDAELEGLICSGAVRRSQHTYALLDERVPEARLLGREDAPAELTRRFFTGHGPASVKDFVRWSGLSVAGANKGLECVKSELMQVTVEETLLWFGEFVHSGPPSSTRTSLLPGYDDCVLTYPRISFPDRQWTRSRDDWNDFIYRPIIIDRMRAGTWWRTARRKSIDFDAKLFATVDETGQMALAADVERYGAFMELPVTLNYL